MDHDDVLTEDAREEKDQDHQVLGLTPSLDRPVNTGDTAGNTGNMDTDVIEDSSVEEAALQTRSK